PGPPDAGRGPGALRCGSPQTARHREGAAGPHKCPGDPGVPMPCSRTPAGTPSHGRGESRRGPRFWRQRRLTAGLAISGLNSTAWTLAVYASQWLLPAPTQDSLPATGQVYRVGLVTHRVATKGFRDAGYIPSSF